MLLSQSKLWDLCLHSCSHFLLFINVFLLSLSLCSLLLSAFWSPLAVHLQQKDCKAPNLGNYRDGHPSNATLHFSTRMQPLPSAEEGRGLAQLIHRRMVLLDYFSCSGLMASSPGKPRSCTGPILFTRTGGFFLKTPTEVAKKNKKITNSTGLGIRLYPFWVNIWGYFPLVSFSTPFLNTIQAHLATGMLLPFISHP